MEHLTLSVIVAGVIVAGLIVAGTLLAYILSDIISWLEYLISKEKKGD